MCGKTVSEDMWASFSFGRYLTKVVFYTSDKQMLRIAFSLELTKKKSASLDILKLLVFLIHLLSAF